MLLKVIGLICLANFCNCIPIGLDDGYYGHGPSISYAAAAPSISLSSLHTYAVPKAIAAPVYHSAPTYVAHAAPAVIAHAAPAIAVAAPVVKKVVAEPYDPNPKYSFSYGVTDHHTGDSKHAEESLVDGVVHGSYSLAEPDGSIRKVTYTADKVNGFNAVVEKQGGAKVVAAAPVVVAPTISKVYASAPSYGYGHGHY